MHRSTLSLVGCLMLLVVAAGCGDSPTAPAVSFMQTDLRVGAGPAAAAGNDLTVIYTGWLYDASKPEQKGLQFDTNVGRDPFTFTLGSGQVIAGWDQGLIGIQAGGIRRLVIPPSLAYGSVRNGPIPPNSVLVFEVEVSAIAVE